MICQSADAVWPTQRPDLFSRFQRTDISAILKHPSNDTWAKIKGKKEHLCVSRYQPSTVLNAYVSSM